MKKRRGDDGRHRVIITLEGHARGVALTFRYSAHGTSPYNTAGLVHEER